MKSRVIPTRSVQSADTYSMTAVPPTPEDVLGRISCAPKPGILLVVREKGYRPAPPTSCTNSGAFAVLLILPDAKLKVPEIFALTVGVLGAAVNCGSPGGCAWG